MYFLCAIFAQLQIVLKIRLENVEKYDIIVECYRVGNMSLPLLGVNTMMTIESQTKALAAQIRKAIKRLQRDQIVACGLPMLRQCSSRGLSTTDVTVAFYHNRFEEIARVQGDLLGFTIFADANEMR